MKNNTKFILSFVFLTGTNAIIGSDYDGRYGPINQAFESSGISYKLPKHCEAPQNRNSEVEITCWKKDTNTAVKLKINLKECMENESATRRGNFIITVTNNGLSCD